MSADSATGLLAQLAPCQQDAGESEDSVCDLCHDRCVAIGMKPPYIGQASEN